MEHAGVVARERRKWIVLTTMLMTIITMIDQTIANTALPTIAHDVQATAADSVWVVNGFQLGMMTTVLTFSQLSDIVGYRRIYLLSVIVFVLASLGCALSHSLLMLTVMRFVQGLSGAATSVSGPPINRLAYPPNMLGRATGFASMAVALGAAAGPIVGGGILAIASWPWLFAINVPIGLVCLGLALWTVPDTPGVRHPFDVESAVLSALTFGLAIVGLDTVGHRGASPLAIGELAGALVLGTIFMRRQWRLPLPMLAVDLFGDRKFALAALACYLSFIPQTVGFIALPFVFQTRMGHTPLQVGELMLPWLLCTAAMAPFAGRLADRWNSSRLAATGMAVFACGLAAAATMGADPSPLDVAWRMALCGLGFGIFQSPNNRSIQGSIPRQRSGSGQAIQAIARVSGQTTGAVAVAIVFARVGHPVGNAISPEAFPVALAAAAACAALTAAISFWRGVIAGTITLARAS